MRLLLDTHVFLWSQSAWQRLGARTRDSLLDADNALYLSAASSWELAIKHALGKIDLPSRPSDYVSERMRKSQLQPLPIEHAHALKVADLPLHHRDPFDRLLIAQSSMEGLVVLTVDPAFSAYDIEVLDASR